MVIILHYSYLFVRNDCVLGWLRSSVEFVRYSNVLFEIVVWELRTYSNTTVMV